MKVFVLGSNGMLGRYVYTYFKLKSEILVRRQGYDVIEINRSKINALDANESALRASLFHLGLRENDIVINCMGLIRQRQGISDLEFLLVNSVFPRILANVCESERARMIHVTTDCVFSGNRGGYNEHDVHDPIDMYGKSKSLGEPSNCTLIRTSILGEELQGKLSLIEWVKSQKDKTVNGYSNHIWNGITCLQFAKVCEEIIENNLWWNGVKHVFTEEPISKDNLVRLISDVFNLNVAVKSIEVTPSVDRSITTILENKIKIPTLKEQLYQLYDYHDILFTDFGK